MMLGDRLHVGHEPRHAHAYVASWIRALDDDPTAVRGLPHEFWPFWPAFVCFRMRPQFVCSRTRTSF